MQISHLLAGVAVAAVALPAQMATAQDSPDGPDWEMSVCAPVHVQNGGTPGLFGLCTAFCSNGCRVSQADTDACKVDNPDPFQVLGCSCGRILDNYNNQRGETDPPMPCVLDAVCPCFDEAFLTTQVANRPAFCNDNTNAVREQTLLDGRDAPPGAVPAGCNAFANALLRFDDAGAPVSAMCQAFNRDRNAANTACVATMNTVQETSFEEFDACQALIRTQIAIFSPPLVCE